MANKALINYYAKLVQRGTYKMDDIDENLHKDVKAAIAKLPPLEDQPEREEPSETDKLVDEIFGEYECSGDCAHCNESESCDKDKDNN